MKIGTSLLPSTARPHNRREHVPQISDSRWLISSNIGERGVRGLLSADVHLRGFGPTTSLSRRTFAVVGNYPITPGVAPGGIRLRIRGLPFQTTEAELRSFFRDFQVAEEHENGGVHLVRGVDRRPTGHAFVHFHTEEEAIRAKEDLHLQFLYPPDAGADTGFRRPYRVEIFEDFPTRVVVRESWEPGDVEEEKLRDEARKSMVGARHVDKERFKEMTKKSH